MPATQESFSRAQALRLVLASDGHPQPCQKRTKAHLLLRVCLRSLSDENHDGGRASAGGGADSVSLVPARIALQGRGTRGRRSDSCPCPPQDESKSGTCLAGPTSPGLRLIPADQYCRESPTTSLLNTHWKRCSCKTLSTISRNMGGVNKIARPAGILGLWRWGLGWGLGD